MNPLLFVTSYKSVLIRFYPCPTAFFRFIYGLGIDQGIIHPLTMLKDAPMSFGAYNPENFDNDFAGPIKAWDALVKSRNVPAVYIVSRLSPPGLHGFLLKAGITRMKDESFYGMSLALGSSEVTMEELVKLYAMLANGGVLKPLKFFSASFSISKVSHRHSGLDPESSDNLDKTLIGVGTTH